MFNNAHVFDFNNSCIYCQADRQHTPNRCIYLSLSDGQKKRIDSTLSLLGKYVLIEGKNYGELITSARNSIRIIKQKEKSLGDSICNRCNSPHNWCCCD